MSAREVCTIDRRRLLWSPDGRSLPKSNTNCFPRCHRRTALAAVGTWVRYIYMNHPNATKPPESLPRMCINSRKIKNQFQRPSCLKFI